MPDPNVQPAGEAPALPEGVAPPTQEPTRVATGAAAAEAGEDAPVHPEAAPRETNAGILQGLTPRPPSMLENRIDKVSDYIAKGFVILIVGAGLIAAMVSSLRPTTARGELEIVAAAQEAPIKDVQAKEPDLGWSIVGRVLRQGKPVENAIVWAIAYDENGNSFSDQSTTTGATGEFNFKPLPKKLSAESKPFKTIRVFASKDESGWFESTNRGETVLTVAQKDFTTLKISVLQTSIWFLMSPAYVILLCLVLAWVVPADDIWASKKYYATHYLALLVPCFMVWVIGDSIYTFHSTVPSGAGEVRTLGFLNFFEGSYAKDVEPEWLVSFTSPPGLHASALKAGEAVKATENHAKKTMGAEEAQGKAAQTARRESRGLGAPFWIVFISVMGSSILLIAFVIKGITDPPNMDRAPGSLPPMPLDPVREAAEREKADKNLEKYSGNLRKVVEQQFYLLFAPLSGVFVYQLLLMGEAASQSALVALTVMGSGAALNVILARSVALAQELVTSKTS